MTPSSADKCQRGREPVVRGDGSIEIPLTHGMVAVVDAEDYPLVRGHLWYSTVNGGLAYAKRRPLPRGTPQIYMHRALVGATGGDVDHINHDTLDNRRANLRATTHQRNQCNMRKRARALSAFKGVTWNARRQKWYAAIQSNGARYHLGVFTNERDAALAYDKAAREMHGEFAHTNEDQNATAEREVA